MIHESLQPRFRLIASLKKLIQIHEPESDEWNRCLKNSWAGYDHDIFFFFNKMHNNLKKFPTKVIESIATKMEWISNALFDRGVWV